MDKVGVLTRSHHNLPLLHYIYNKLHLDRDTLDLSRWMDEDILQELLVYLSKQEFLQFQELDQLKTAVIENGLTFTSLLLIEERRMIWDFLKSKEFNVIFSFLLGLGLAAILRPACKGDQCLTLKAPPMKDMKEATFQLGNKCYQFEIENVECPSKGIIEAFQISRA